jgi:prophage DNA circulation protein
MNEKAKEEEELIWLPKSLCERLKPIQAEEVLREAVLKYAHQNKEYLKDDLDIFQEAVSDYRISLEKVKNDFKEAKDSQLNALNEMWEGFEKDITKIRDNNKKVIGELQPLRLELEEIKSLMSSLSKWSLEDLLKVIEKINSYNQNTKDIIQFLFENYRIKEKP